MQVVKLPQVVLDGQRVDAGVTGAASSAPAVSSSLSTGDSDNVELAMTEEALTGFLSWLEASRPARTSPTWRKKSMAFPW